jgi:hypothetical protein
MKETVDGLVVDVYPDCEHLGVMDDRGFDALHRILKEFEGKKVRITIQER